MTSEPSTVRPRVEGERELEILSAALEVLDEVGYDLLTMDAVAARARASKATLYRRWNSRPELVVAAIHSRKGPVTVPDTGSLREDLLGVYCGIDGLHDRMSQTVMAAVVTAMSRDPEFADVYRRDFIAPRMAVSRQIFTRAQERGEVAAEADLDIITPALAGIVLHRAFLLGDEVTPQLVGRILDEIILPAVRRG